MDLYQVMSIAFFWGAVSAISLPLGSYLGLLLKPSRRVNSILMAFGAGALLFALTVELFAESLEKSHHFGQVLVIWTMVGAVLGGLLFDLLNSLLNSKGAFLRNFSWTKKYVFNLSRIRNRKVIELFSKVEFLRCISPSILYNLIKQIHWVKLKKGELLFDQGEFGDALYIIDKGIISIEANQNGREHQVALLKEKDVVGEMALVIKSPRTARAVAQTDCSLIKIRYKDIYFLLEKHPHMNEVLSLLVQKRLDDLKDKHLIENERDWKNDFNQFCHSQMIHLPEEQVYHEGKKASASSAAPLAIWLGIFLDGIPESLVIGMLAHGVGGMSLAFIAGVFLANFPEAMSSSVTMEKSGLKKKRILIMWSSLTLVTALGAALGAFVFVPTDSLSTLYIISMIEGVAAGAMLTMIAETMLPEAYEQGGRVVGMATLFGFLCALSVKILA